LKPRVESQHTLVESPHYRQHILSSVQCEKPLTDRTHVDNTGVHENMLLDTLHHYLPCTCIISTDATNKTGVLINIYYYTNKFKDN